MGSSSSKVATISTISVVPVIPPNEQHSEANAKEHDKINVAESPTKAQEQSLSLTSTTTTRDTTKKQKCPFKFIETTNR